VATTKTKQITPKSGYHIELKPPELNERFRAYVIKVHGEKTRAHSIVIRQAIRELLDREA